MAAASIKLGATGNRVDDLQKGIDAILGRRRFKWRKVAIDGVAGHATFKSAHLALWLIGASDEQLRAIRRNDRITNRGFELLTGQVEHTAAMKKRDRERRADAKKLRHEHQVSNEQGDKDGLAQWRGFTVAAWMVGEADGPDGQRRNWLQLSVERGWSGGLYSGYRDPAYSRGLCEVMCNAPSCPGMCAGEASNHSQTGPPNWGAIDVQDYDTFGRIQREIGSPLKNNLPLDHPHYSYTGA